MAGIEVVPTRNFERNLDGVEQFLTERGEQQYFQQLLDRLFKEVIPNLQKFPEMGRDFMLRQPGTTEGLHLYSIIDRQSSEIFIREYLFDQYLLLYAVKASKLYLLSIKHHAQLSFDLPAHWSG